MGISVSSREDPIPVQKANYRNDRNMSPQNMSMPRQPANPESGNNYYYDRGILVDGARF